MDLEKTYRDQHTYCRNCGCPIIKNRQRKYCYECAELNKKVYDRVFMNNKRNKKYKNINACIELSDKKFVTELCNGDCFNCIFSDCILEVD